jgi:hypothetical protein
MTFMGTVLMANGANGHMWQDVLIDSAIAGGAAFFGALIGVGPSVTAVYAGFVAFGIAFFATATAARRREP